MTLEALCRDSRIARCKASHGSEVTACRDKLKEGLTMKGISRIFFIITCYIKMF